MGLTTTDDRVHPVLPGDPPQVGGYVLLGRLGAGGSGTVFLARTPDWQLVAVKIVHRRLAADSAIRHRLRTGVERARRVVTPYVARVIDADIDHDPPYVVTEYVDGPSLADRPLPPGDVYALATTVAGALAALHAAGVVHGDLKPRHILLGPDGARVVDFGVAPAYELTSVGAFTAPERFASNAAPPTPAADVFEWGAVIAYAATGRQGPEFADLDVFTEPLRGLVRAALEPEPGARPTAQNLVDGLQALPAAPITADPPQPEPARSRPRWRRRSLLVSALLLVLVSLAAGAFTQLHRRHNVSVVVADPGLAAPVVVAPAAPSRVAAASGVPSRSVAATPSASASPRASRTTAAKLPPAPSPPPPPTTAAATSPPAVPQGPPRGPLSIRSGLNGQCLTDAGASVVLKACGGRDTIWQFLSDGTIRRRDQCLNATPEVTVGACGLPTGQHWRFTNNALINTDTKQCVDTGDLTRGGVAPVEVRTCNATPAQKWSLAP
jgi:serine/threonine protein kinase